MSTQLTPLACPWRFLPLLVALLSLLLPSESSALIRQNPTSGSFFSSEWETCRNDPVNNSDPLGLEGGLEDCPTANAINRYVQELDDLTGVSNDPSAQRSKAAARSLRNTVVSGTEFVAGLNPVVSVFDAASGRNQVTGEKLSGIEVGLAAVSLVPGEGILATLSRPMKKWWRASRGLDSLAQKVLDVARSDKFMATATAEGLGQHLPQLEQTIQRLGNLGRIKRTWSTGARLSTEGLEVGRIRLLFGQETKISHELGHGLQDIASGGRLLADEASLSFSEIQTIEAQAYRMQGSSDVSAELQATLNALANKYPKTTYGVAIGTTGAIIIYEVRQD